MPSLFTLFCSCFDLSRIKSNTSITSTKIQKVAHNSRKQTNDFPEKKNALENAELSTIHLTLLAPTAPPKQKQIIDFFEVRNTRPSFAEICPSAVFNREIPTTS